VTTKSAVKRRSLFFLNKKSLFPYTTNKKVFSSTKIHEIEKRSSDMESPVANVAQVQVEAQSFVDKLKDFFQVDKWMQSFDFSTSHLIKMGTYAVVGFLLGFFFKKYGRSLIIVVCTFAILLYALSYMSVITFHWDQARTIIGLTPQDSFETLLQGLWEYVQKQVALVVCLLIGFIIGYKAA
jgi:uncharacterized membrane protein (Fun14 family)